MRLNTLISLGFVAAIGCADSGRVSYDGSLDIRGRDFSVNDLGGPYAWTLRTPTPTTTQNFNAVTWDGTRYLVVGDNNVVATSVNPSAGVVFTSAIATVAGQAEGGYKLTSVASDGAHAVATAVYESGNGDHNVRLVSGDAASATVGVTTWADVTGDISSSLGSNAMNAVAFNGYFAAVGAGGRTYYSTTGASSSWVNTTNDGSANIIALTNLGTSNDTNGAIYNWLGVGATGAIDTIAFHSSNGGSSVFTTQTYPTGSTAQTLNAVAGTTATTTPASTDYFVAVGNGTSPAGGVTDIIYKQGTNNWLRVSSGTTQPLYSVAWTGHNFIAVGKAGTVLVSAVDSPTNWTAYNISTTSDLRGISANNERIVVVGTGGVIYSAEKPTL